MPRWSVKEKLWRPSHGLEQFIFCNSFKTERQVSQQIKVRPHYNDINTYDHRGCQAPFDNLNDRTSMGNGHKCSLPHQDRHIKHDIYEIK